MRQRERGRERGGQRVRGKYMECGLCVCEMERERVMNYGKSDREGRGDRGIKRAEL